MRNPGERCLAVRPLLCLLRARFCMYASLFNSKNVFHGDELKHIQYIPWVVRQMLHVKSSHKFTKTTQPPPHHIYNARNGQIYMTYAHVNPASTDALLLCKNRLQQRAETFELLTRIVRVYEWNIITHGEILLALYFTMSHVRIGEALLPQPGDSWLCVSSRWEIIRTS